jgi:TRAP-type uncharacterized transport system fused permease subunit
MNYVKEMKKGLKIKFDYFISIGFWILSIIAGWYENTSRGYSLYVFVIWVLLMTVVFAWLLKYFKIYKTNRQIANKLEPPSPLAWITWLLKYFKAKKEHHK